MGNLRKIRDIRLETYGVGEDEKQVIVVQEFDPDTGQGMEHRLNAAHIDFFMVYDTNAGFPALDDVFPAFRKPYSITGELKVRCDSMSSELKDWSKQ